MRRIVGEVIRFLLVGGLATTVSFVGFNVLVHGLFLGTAPLRNQPVTAFVLVNVVAGCVAYVGMRVWAFQDRDARDPATGLVRFFGLGALTMTIPVMCLWMSRHVLGLHSPLLTTSRPTSSGSAWGQQSGSGFSVGSCSMPPLPMSRARRPHEEAR